MKKKEKKIKKLSKKELKKIKGGVAQKASFAPGWSTMFGCNDRR